MSGMATKHAYRRILFLIQRGVRSEPKSFTGVFIEGLRETEVVFSWRSDERSMIQPDMAMGC